jgi:hypothetical protein
MNEGEVGGATVARRGGEEAVAPVHCALMRSSVEGGEAAREAGGGGGAVGRWGAGGGGEVEDDLRVGPACQ